jgi:hypothetical protein
MTVALGQATKGVLETGSQMPGPFVQYFMNHE